MKKNIAKYGIRLGIGLAAMASMLIAAGAKAATPSDYKQRFAIAISGGASKGAYEAGLNWALIKIINATSGAPSVLGGEFYRAEIESVTGASAGGINSLLSAIAWCTKTEALGGVPNSISNNVFRDTWLLPDVNQLLPEDPASPIYRPDDAMLSRKTLLDAADSLRKKWNSFSFRPGCSIKLGVTVTRVEPQTLTLGNVEVQNQRFYFPFEFYVDKDGQGRFRFDPDDYAGYWDPAMLIFPTKKGSPKNQILDEQIQEAVLTSSAFPVAFGRKRLKYCRLKTRRVTVGDLEEEKENATADKEWRCPSGYMLERAEFSDGGLFDNLPLGLARILAERSERGKKKPGPITYVYLDPNRLRYEVPEKRDVGACGSKNPPKACDQLEYNFSSESSLLLGAMGTARKYELYRELLGEQWALNLPEIVYAMSNDIGDRGSKLNCKEEFPYFDRSISCIEAMQRTGQMMEIIYDHRRVPVTSPFSVSKLQAANLVYGCVYRSKPERLEAKAVCSANMGRFRERLARSLEITSRRAGLYDRYGDNIQKSRRSFHNDRIIRVSSRGAPITGTLLADFGAFLDYKFREYDYYVGIYDAVLLASAFKCRLHYSQVQQARELGQCMTLSATHLSKAIGLSANPRGKYVFALLAKREFGNRNQLQFAWKKMPQPFTDLKLIHEGLEKSLIAGEKREVGASGAFAVEKEFFYHLNAGGFEPTHTKRGSEPILRAIMDDPERWSYELTKRVSRRLVYLEQEAEEIYKAREPDPEKREKAMTGIMGVTAHVLQSTTYKYPEFTLAPSTAPENWFWRNIIPYEIGVDMAESDFMMVWQPTWSLGKTSTLGLRTSYSVAGGLLQSIPTTRPDYITLGFEWSRLTGKGLFSSWGITPSYVHRLGTPASGGAVGTTGLEAHVGLFENRLRLGFGTNNTGSVNNTRRLTVGLTDIPGWIYWLTR
jgi:hypothetical protein